MPVKAPGDAETLREHFAWVYGNLAMTHAALTAGASSYGRLHYMIRGRFRKGYLTGTMNMRSLTDDERTKIEHGSSCCYCGARSRLTLDHVLPKLTGGTDAAENISYACKSCNSSKGPRDMVLWLVNKGRFPSVLVLRRYLKLAAQAASSAGLLDTAWSEAPDDALPFDKRSLRVEWPALAEFEMWPDGSGGGSDR